MTYNPSIPQSTDRPSDSQGQLLNNFTALNTIFDQEHVTFNATADNGEHRKITFNDVLGADPGLADPKASLYTKTVAGDSELFYEKYDNVATANQINQLTNLAVTSGVRHGGTQRTILTPFGFRITMGSTAAFSGTSTDNYITAFTTVIYSATATANDVNPQQISLTTNLTQLSLRTANSVSVYYFIIGV